MSSTGLVAANQIRAEHAAVQQVAQARKAIRTLESHRPRRDSHHSHLMALLERVRYPRSSLGEIATEIGVTKDVYASRLRRALAYARWLDQAAA
jgi:DNA-binding transcriptional regulator WhiA